MKLELICNFSRSVARRVDTAVILPTHDRIKISSLLISCSYTRPILFGEAVDLPRESGFVRVRDFTPSDKFTWVNIHGYGKGNKRGTQQGIGGGGGGIYELPLAFQNFSRFENNGNFPCN